MVLFPTLAPSTLEAVTAQASDSLTYTAAAMKVMKRVMHLWEISQ